MTPVSFAVIGLNHDHIYGLVDTMVQNGGRLVSFYAIESELIAPFARKYPTAILARSEQEILDTQSISLVLSAAIPSERSALGIRVMQHGKDFLCDKPGATSLEQLTQIRAAQTTTHRLYAVMFGERLESRATVKASELVQSGAIGNVVQTIGVGPHRLGAPRRPHWFWNVKQTGGILCDIGSHQFDQFLHFTNSNEAEVVSAQVRNTSHVQHLDFHDFGDAIVRGNGGSGYLRVDWLSPDNLPTWGDTRLTVLGTTGYLEVRKNIDIAGRAGADHLFLVNESGARYIECSHTDLPFGRLFLGDVQNRTHTALSQHQCFLAMELALTAQQMALRLPAFPSGNRQSQQQ